MVSHSSSVACAAAETMSRILILLLSILLIDIVVIWWRCDAVAAGHGCGEEEHDLSGHQSKLVLDGCNELQEKERQNDMTIPLLLTLA